MKILAENLGFPEGPVVMPDGSVALVEMRVGKITRVERSGKVSLIVEPGGGPNGMALGPGGKLFVCNNGGIRWVRRGDAWIPAGAESKEYSGGRIEIVDPHSGRIERLYDSYDGRSLGAPNDLVFEAGGDFWFTDTGAFRKRDRDLGAVYWAKADGSQLKRVLFPLERPNGIGLSPDGKRLYVADTPSGRLWAWDITGPGEVKKVAGHGIVGGTLAGATADMSRFDSLKVTASGAVCVANNALGGIDEFRPGDIRAIHHPLPDAHTTNLAFGGSDMRTVYVTMADSGTLGEIPWHEPGLRLNFN